MAKTIQIKIDEKQLTNLVKELKLEGYVVEKPLELVHLLIQKQADDISFFVMEFCCDAGGLSLIGDVLNNKEAKACGVTGSDGDEDEEDEDDY